MNKFIKIILLLIASFTMHLTTNACDICGCGVGNNYIGILPEYQSSIIGLRYRYNSMHTHLDPNGATSYLNTTEQFNVAELYGGIQFRPNWRMMFALPYNIVHKMNAAGTSTKNGLGDPMALLQYQILNQKSTINDKINIVTLWFSVGVKAPLGEYSSDAELAMNNTNTFQLGTGSWDFVTQMMYDWRLQDWGANITAQYKINTTNKASYYYGNKLQSSLQLYRKFAIGKDKNVAPNIGYNIEYSDQDIKQNIAVLSTGGWVQKANCGIEVKLHKVFMGLNYQYVWYQNIGIGSVKVNNGFMVHLGYTL